MWCLEVIKHMNKPKQPAKKSTEKEENNEQESNDKENS